MYTIRAPLSGGGGEYSPLNEALISTHGSSPAWCRLRVIQSAVDESLIPHESKLKYREIKLQ